MSFRQVINRRPGIIITLVVLFVAIAGWAVWSQATEQTGRPPKAAYFTIDDGKTWFVDDLNKLPPFEKDGKEAVLAHVFTCNGKEVCGYIERYVARAKTLIEEGRKKPVVPGSMPQVNGELVAMGQGAREVKKPGDSVWVNMNAGGMTIVRFACPGGAETAEVKP